MKPLEELTDERIRVAFERRAARATAGDQGEVIRGTTVAVRQRQRVLGLPLRWRWGRMAPIAAVVLTAGALVVASLGAGQHQPPAVTPSPSSTAAVASSTPSLTPARTGRADDFVRPFSYVVPGGSNMTLPAFDDRIYPFVEAGGNPGSGPVGGGPAVGRGVTVVSAQEPTVHGATQSGGRAPISTDPAQFMIDLRTMAHADLGEPAPTTLDGRPALSVEIRASNVGDFHYRPGLSSHVPLTNPGRLIVADVNGITVVVMIWAASPEYLDGWLPTATAFVNSIRFDP
jgi:hypothetical protein